jgi:hypothetical protein
MHGTTNPKGFRIFSLFVDLCTLFKENNNGMT